MTTTDPLPHKTRAANGAGSVHQLRGMWRIAFMDSDGKRKFRKSPIQTERGAHAFLAKTLAARDAGETTARSPKLAEFVETFIDAKRINCRPRTLEAYRERLNVHIVPRLGHLRLDKLTATNVTRLYADLSAEGLGPTTIAHVHDTLRNLLRVAKRRRLVAHVVTEQVDSPRRAEFEARTLSIDEAKLLLTSPETLSHRHGNLFIFLLGTGCRFGEAAGLTWGAVDIHNATAFIHQQVSRRRDPRSRRITHVVSPVKTSAGKRTVHLPGWVLAALERQRELTATLGLPAEPPAFVFPGDTGAPLPENTVLTTWHRLLVRLGIEHVGQPRNENVRLHDMRHGLAQLMLESGEELITISHQLGHAQLSITADIYTRRSSRTTKAAAERFGRLLEPDKETDHA